MKKLIILFELIIILYLITIPKAGIEMKVEANTEAKEEAIIKLKEEEIKEVKMGKYFIMTCTAYTIHPKCTPNNKGITAINTKVREGIVAINVDWINNKWVIKSPLNLRQKIYIEGLGYFTVEDTGYFTEEDYHFDYWNLDVYCKDYNKAKKWGRKLIRVFIKD